MRALPGEELSQLYYQGVRLGDNLTIIPIQGKQRVLKLQRTQIFFTSNEQLAQAPEKCPILLPSLNYPELSFYLELCKRGQFCDDQNGRYMLKSNGRLPFRINGSFCYEALVERGDRVELGHNKLLFSQNPIPTVAIPSGETDELIYAPEIQRIITSHIPILLEGETGTGKTHLADIIHQKSGRKGEFIHVNLASFSKNLLESELFGHVKGSFTGALNDRKGAFLRANEGTLFLDEIDSIDWELQTKLLLFFDSGKIRPVGSDQYIKGNARIICASGQNLTNLLNKGLMRKDFYFRISSGHKILRPPLRNFPERIIEFCANFEVKEEVVIPLHLKRFYQSLPWPGNFRQLQFHLQKKKVLSKGKKWDFDRWDEELLVKSSNICDIVKEGDYANLELIKSQYMLKVFHHCQGNLETSARILNISLSTMRSFIKKQNLLLKA